MTPARLAFTLALLTCLAAAAQKSPASRRAPVEPIRIEASVYKTDGPAPRSISSTFTGHAALTPDGEELVYLDATGLHVVKAGGGEPRKLAGPAPWFRLSRDMRYAILPGKPWRRVSIRAKDGPITVAAGVKARPSTGAVSSERHVAFNSVAGHMVVADLVEGTARPLKTPMPKDPRCTQGAGAPKSFSANGEWLLYQRGCDGMEIVRVDGTKRRPLAMESARFVDNLVVGNGLEGGPLQVMDLERDRRWAIGGARMASFHRVPGRAALLQARDNRLELIDLLGRSRTVLHEGGARRVSTFVRSTTDGARGLFVVMGDNDCEVLAVDLERGGTQRLARVTGARQCFVEGVGDKRAALYVWRAGKDLPTEAVLAVIDLETREVRRLGPVMKRQIGSLHAAGERFMVSGKGFLLVAP